MLANEQKNGTGQCKHSAATQQGACIFPKVPVAHNLYEEQQTRQIERQCNMCALGDLLMLRLTGCRIPCINPCGCGGTLCLVAVGGQAHIGGCKLDQSSMIRLQINKLHEDENIGTYNENFGKKRFHFLTAGGNQNSGTVMWGGVDFGPNLKQKIIF